MICANLYPRYYTLIPCSALLGFFASVLWTGQGTYVTFASQAYSKQRQKDPQSALGFFNGTFFGIFQTSTVIGYLLSSLILGSTTGKTTTLFVVYAIICATGVAGVLLLPPERPLPTEEPQPQADLLYGGDIEEDTATEEKDIPLTEDTGEPPRQKEAVTGAADEATWKRIWDGMMTTGRIMRDRKMALLLPLMLYDGLSRGFTTADFTGSIITPCLGVNSVGLVMAVYAATNAIFCAAFGKIGDVIGMRVIVFVGVLLHAIFFIFFIVWTEVFGLQSLGEWPMRLVIWPLGSVLGAGDALLYSVFSATMMGTFNGKVAAFSTFKFWTSLGYVVAFVWGSYVSLTLKCALVLACLVVSAHAVLVLDRVVQPITQKGLKGQHPAAAVETDKRALLDKEQESDM
eukprot:TRINITY_DN222_c1_g1_i6.p1 TRINITY_DN222_c1_g1~~TRINITY_DN222_c1_g1_i6.p1  ORF type:complete len:402 (-),score=90.34 TRINITY_DN222_c1_g1_i6:40-1245(-)